MTFGELQTVVADWLNRGDLTATIPTLIKMAQLQIERKYNFKYMEKKTTSLVVSGGLVTVPSDYKEVKYFHVIVDGEHIKLHKAVDRYIWGIYPYSTDQSGRPEMYALTEGRTKFLLRPYPDTNYSYELLYYAFSPVLSDPSDTNFLTNYAYDVLIYGALEHAAPYIKDDERVAVWKMKRDEALRDLFNQEAAEDVAGTPLYVQPGSGEIV